MMTISIHDWIGHQGDSIRVKDFIHVTESALYVLLSFTYSI